MVRPTVQCAGARSGVGVGLKVILLAAALVGCTTGPSGSGTPPATLERRLTEALEACRRAGEGIEAASLRRQVLSLGWHEDSAAPGAYVVRLGERSLRIEAEPRSRVNPCLVTLSGGASAPAVVLEAVRHATSQLEPAPTLRVSGESIAYPNASYALWRWRAPDDWAVDVRVAPDGRDLDSDEVAAWIAFARLPGNQ